MAVTNRTPDEILGNNLNDGVFNQNITDVGDSIGEDGMSDKTGGGSIASNIFVFNISSNEKSFTTLLNGNAVANSKLIRIARKDIALENKRIQIKKTGFKNNNEYYIVEMISDGGPIIDNPNFDQPLGIGTKDVVLTKYRNGEVVGKPISIKNNTSVQLEFNLTKIKDGDEYEEPKSYNTSFNVSGGQASVSVLKNGNKNAEFFPKKGASSYSDVEGTKYTIRSSDTTLYRITNILYTSATKEQSLSANVGESLEITVTLNSDYIFDIIVEEVFQGTPAKDPQIQLVKGGAREYNINSKAGVPLMFRKNADVEAITVIIGEDVFEFDDLDSGDLCGVTIPHSAFRKIGKYNVKIFPFSFDDYENQVRPAEPADTIETKNTEIKYNIKEEVVEETPKAEDKYNKYKPTPGGGSGGGGRGDFGLFDGINNDPTNPFTNDGSFVNRPTDNINQR
jgi:hypothetical protein